MPDRHPLLLLALAPALASAAALTDGSTGAVQSLSGAFTVPQALGTVRGANLFHSFTRFGIAPGESATFSTSDAGIRHVISRVTGGEASTLHGPLRLQAAGGSRPDFWLVNPSGITVGAGARFDVPAGLHLSTAQQLRFADGVAWDTRNGTASSLTVAAPEGFGFLGPQAAAALRWRDADLRLEPGQTLDLAGGELSLQRALIAAPGGQIRLAATGAVALGDHAQLYASTGDLPGSGLLRIDAGSLTLDGRQGFASLVSNTDAGLLPPATAIDLRIGGALSLLAESEIMAVSSAERTAGRLRIDAGSMSIDGLGQQPATVASYAMRSGSGPAIDIELAGGLSLHNGGQLFAATLGTGNGGAISLRSGSLDLAGDGNFAFIGTQSLRGAGGDAGALYLQVQGALTLTPGSLITSQSAGGGAAGRIDLGAGSMRVDAEGRRGLTGVQSLGAGPVQVAVAGALELLNGGLLESVSISGQRPAALQVQAREIRLDGGGIGGSQITSRSSNEQPSAGLRVQAGERLTLSRGAQINALTLGRSGAGDVTIQSPTIELTGGGDFVTHIASSVFGPEGGHAGQVDITASGLSVRAGASIYADNLSAGGNAGRITVRADRVLLEGQGQAGGIRSIAQGSSGDAGQVLVEAREQLVVRSGAGIMASTFGSGATGQITVNTPSLLIDGRDAGFSFTGIAGDSLLGIGVGSTVVVDAGQLTLVNGGTIVSSTFTAAAAGSVDIRADRLTLDGGDRSSSTGISADSGGSGRAGTLRIQAREIQMANEALISSSALSSGAGGSISIDAERLAMDSGAAIVSVTAGSGAAGNLDVKVAGELLLHNGASMSANTGGRGAAGRISVNAGSLQMGGVDPVSGFTSQLISRARPGSGGQPGNLTLQVHGDLEMADGARLSIANDAVVANPHAILPTTLSVQAGRIRLADSEITAAASANANAGRLVLESASSLRLDRSRVRTSALDGDGGPITVDAAGTVHLRDAQISTSVGGRNNGNGGNITLSAPALVLESGFIQANTNAPLARGGDVRVDVRTLLPNGSNVFIGGNRAEAPRSGLPGFNVIQAAAPDGVSGTLDVAIPQLNLAGSLVGLSTAVIDFGLLWRDLCQIAHADAQSSLSRLGRGALPTPAAAPLRWEP